MAKPAGPLCNLDCHYCYYLGKSALFPEGPIRRMPDELLERYVRTYIASSPGPLVHFEWHGGEPLLAGLDFFRRAVELQKHYLPPGWGCVNSIQTNGTLLDAQWCSFFAEQTFHVGLSLDGPASVHDPSRVTKGGGPTHQRVLRGLRLLQEHGIDPDVLCTVNAHSAAHPLETYRFFLRHDVTWLQFIPIVRHTRNGEVSEDSVTPEALGTFLCTIFDEWVRHDMARISIQTFLESLRVWSGQPSILCVMAETCGHVLVVEHDGSLYSCDHFVDPEHRLGTLEDLSPGDAAGSARQIEFGNSKRDSLPSQCRTCPVLFACNGGCPRDRFATTPDGEPGLNYLCAGYRAFYQHITPYMERMVAHMRSGRNPSLLMEELKRQEGPEERRWAATSRNDPCPCGSGRKFKTCCLPLRRPYGAGAGADVPSRYRTRFGPPERPANRIRGAAR